MQANMYGFNFALNQFRFGLRLRKGTIIIWNGKENSLLSVGYLNIIQEPPVNDNEAKP